MSHPWNCISLVINTLKNNPHRILCINVRELVGLLSVHHVIHLYMVASHREIKCQKIKTNTKTVRTLQVMTSLKPLQCRLLIHNYWKHYLFRLNNSWRPSLSITLDIQYIEHAECTLVSSPWKRLQHIMIGRWLEVTTVWTLSSQ